MFRPETMKTQDASIGLVLSMLPLLACAAPQAPASGPRATNAYTLVGEASYVDGYPAYNDDGTINVVVEVPAGTNAKWEVDKADGNMRWEFKNGSPRVVRYLPYPANYGMIPSTLLPAELGGDGDPLDVVVLCPALERGTLVRARLIGILELLDGGEQDSKLLAVVNESPLGSVDDMDELDKKFPGVSAILEEWFTGYKGPGKMESRGFGSTKRARKVLEQAAAAFAERH
jgi:inorganic pyrophosphatase